MSVRIGFIGPGGIAQIKHLQILSNNPDAEVVAYCDIDLSKAQKAAAEYGGNAYQAFEQMLDQEDLEAVVICTPPFAHGDIELAACEAGLHMMIEKPVALNMATAQPILEAVESAGIVTLVGYRFRWEDHVHKARQLLQDQTIGLVFGNFCGGTSVVPWWRVKSKSGGQMVEQTTHIFDMARFMAGEVSQVQAFGTLQAMDSVYSDFDVWDASTANLEFTNGAVGTISSTCLSQNWYQSSLRVVARDIMVNIDGYANTLTWASEKGQGDYTNQVDGYAEESRVFVDAIVTGNRSQIYSDYADAVKTLAVTEAVTRSIENGGEIVAINDLLP